MEKFKQQQIHQQPLQLEPRTIGPSLFNYSSGPTRRLYRPNFLFHFTTRASYISGSKNPYVR